MNSDSTRAPSQNGKKKKKSVREVTASHLYFHNRDNNYFPWSKFPEKLVFGEGKGCFQD